jgi:hypothetical protein
MFPPMTRGGDVAGDIYFGVAPAVRLWSAVVVRHADWHRSSGSWRRSAVLWGGRRALPETCIQQRSRAGRPLLRGYGNDANPHFLALASGIPSTACSCTC